MLSDLSPFSKVVAKKALNLAAVRGKDLDVLHVEEQPFFDFFKEKSGEYVKKCEEDLRQTYSIDAASGASKANDGTNDANASPASTGAKDLSAQGAASVRIFCKCGNLIQIVQEHIRQNNISAIIVGFKHKRTLLEDITDGSYLNSIVRKTNVPVIVIKTEELGHYENILIPSDLSSQSAQNISYLAKIFTHSNFFIEHYYSVFFEYRMKTYGFDAHQMQVFADHYKQEAKANLDAFIKGLSLPRTVKIHARIKKYTEMNEMVMSSIQDDGIDLISLSTSGYVSVFSFNLLEASPKDVILYKI